MRESAEYKAAKLGARWLDQYEPGWANSIDLRTLKMEDETQCVLGQCFTGYYDALNDLRPKDIERDEPWARAHGFNGQLTSDGSKDRAGSYERLAIAWAPLIAIRQVQGKKKR